MKKQTPFYDDRLHLREFGKIPLVSQKQKNILHLLPDRLYLIYLAVDINLLLFDRLTA